MCLFYILTIHYFVVGHIGCLHFLAVVNRASSVVYDVFGHVTWSGIAGSHTRFTFSFLRILYWLHQFANDSFIIPVSFLAFVVGCFVALRHYD